MDQFAEYFLGATLVAVTLYSLVRIALAYFFPQDT
jgi:hypothetical protein